MWLVPVTWLLETETSTVPWKVDTIARWSSKALVIKQMEHFCILGDSIHYLHTDDSEKENAIGVSSHL